MSFSDRIKARALEQGFDLVGIAPVETVPELDFYKDWVDAGYAGQMAYLERDVEKRTDVRRVVHEARSVIVCAMLYDTDYPYSTDVSTADRGWISRYAWGDDYHDVMAQQLHGLVDFIDRESRAEVIGRVYIDTGPVVDRVYAKYAGIGWFGKNTCIINQQKGSWFFLGEIITNLELEYDTPAPDRCGSCTKCIDACPTDAILEPYVLDSRLCISYSTIELRDDIPESIRNSMGNHVFGCDICQDVCPWNRKSPKTEVESYQPRQGLFHPDLRELANMSLDEFRTRFRKNPVRRAKYPGFLRNVAVAMGNSQDGRFLPDLRRLAGNGEPMVARHAEWAISKIEHTLEVNEQHQ